MQVKYYFNKEKNSIISATEDVAIAEGYNLVSTNNAYGMNEATILMENVMRSPEITITKVERREGITVRSKSDSEHTYIQAMSVVQFCERLNITPFEAINWLESLDADFYNVQGSKYYVIFTNTDI